MNKKISVNDQKISVEIVIPQKISEFLNEHDIIEKRLLNNHRWEECLDEDLCDKESIPKSIKVVISYISIDKEHSVKVDPSLDQKELARDMWVKGSFFRKFSIGYVIFSN